MNGDLISVIVPVYNTEKYLERCIESIVSQTYKNLEIILVDDGSPDNCPKICDDWAEKDNRIKVVHTKNRGAAKARNIGLDLLSGDYVAFVDSDDYISNNMLQLLYNSLNNNNTNIAICGNYEVYDSDLVKTNFIHSDKEKLDYDEYIIFTNDDLLYFNEILCNKLYRSFIWKDTRLNEELKKYEDSDILPFIYERAKTISIVNEPLYYYYQNNYNSTMHSTVEYNDIAIRCDILYKRVSHFKSTNNNLFKYYILSNMKDLQNNYASLSKNEKSKKKLLKERYSNYLNMAKENSIYENKKQLLLSYFFNCFPEVYMKLKKLVKKR